jgi:hypothetical protein
MRTALFGVLLSLPLALSADMVRPQLSAPGVYVQSAAPAAPVVLVTVAPTAAATPETAAVTVSARKSPSGALHAALWPGFIIHGAGYRAAGDDDAFLNLAGGEIFSVVLLGFGMNEAFGPGIPGETKITSQSIAVAGGVIFLGTWAWDLIGAGDAAREFNQKNGLTLRPGLSPKGGAQLAMALPF